jgi:hypothetical protein
MQKKREALVDQVLELVREYINREGGMSQYELSSVFHEGLAADALARMTLKFSSPGG